MTVYLLGAGPGDPELLTVKASRLLATADVVVHDRLVSPEIVGLAPPWAELIPVGKDPDGQSVSQEQINSILVDRGRRAGVVVRLKGGDPFVFGRGGEECLALQAGGGAHEVVPGISSAMAGPAVAGIPVTHRSLSSGFTVVTGHSATTGTDVDWVSLARSGTTLVILMGARRAARIRDRLLAAGLAPQTPVATVTWATTTRQSTSRMTLVELGEQPVINPAIIVIGAVAALDLASIANPATTTAVQRSLVSTR